jgi:hypothetical protein
MKHALISLVAIVVLASGCGGDDTVSAAAGPGSGGAGGTALAGGTGAAGPGGGGVGGAGGAAPVGPLVAEAGFIEIAARSVTVGGVVLDVPAQRLWHSFHPADDAPDDKPVALFFNGLSAATSGLMFAANTAPWTLDPEIAGVGIASNPASFTQFANTLHVDVDLTGFSYALSPSDPPEGGLCMSQNAANVILVLLAFLADHPALQDNPVILIGESFGGIRAQLMLRSLLDYPSLQDATNLREYQDEVLFDAVVAHYADVFPGAPDPVPPATIAQQFGHQVLIQPAVGGDELQLYPPISANCLSSGWWDPYQCDEAAGWFVAQSDIVEPKLVNPLLLSTVLGVPIETIPLLAPAARGDAFRALENDGGPTVDDALMVALLGPLTSRDRYFVGSADVFYGSNLAVGPSGMQGSLTTVEEVDPRGSDLGAEFLANVLHVRTFITDAELDRLLYTPWIGSGLLAKHPSVLSNAVHDSAPQAGVDRPGWLTLTYQQEGALVIRIPHYPTAGHVVTKRASSELLADVIAWYGSPP